MECSRTLQKSPTKEDDFSNLFRTFMESLEEKDVQLFVAIARQLWHRRNSVVFKGTMSPPAVVLQNARAQVDNYEKVVQARNKITEAFAQICQIRHGQDLLQDSSRSTGTPHD